MTFKSHNIKKYMVVGKMSILELDNKGRLILPKKMRESLKMGKKFWS